MANSTNNNTYAVLIEFEKWYKKQNIKYPYASALKNCSERHLQLLERKSMERKAGIRTPGVTIRKESYTTPYKEL